MLSRSERLLTIKNPLTVEITPKMRNKTLVINCGSSSLKFGLYEQGNRSPLVTGLAEALSSDSARAKIAFSKSEQLDASLPGADHETIINHILGKLERQFALQQQLLAVGHRVVHGGEHFNKACIVNESVLTAIRDCTPLAPLHNPANLMGIELLTKAYPNVPQVTVFDTAFHQTMPACAYRYALPKSLYDELSVRRYGFHGTSHHFVAEATAEQIGKPLAQCSFISAHLGNGASVCAIASGKSVDTSMGMTPLEGLVMGTRSGDIDPGIFAYLLRQGYTGEQIDTLLNKQSGLLGVSGLSNDMRTLEKAASEGNSDAALAIDLFCFRLAKHISGMRISLDTIDGLIFTGGIGENSTNVRSKTVALLSGLGFKLDDAQNRKITSDIAAIHDGTSLPIFVTKTDEEWMIASQSAELCMN